MAGYVGGGAGRICDGSKHPYVMYAAHEEGIEPHRTSGQASRAGGQASRASGQASRASGQAIRGRCCRRLATTLQRVVAHVRKRVQRLPIECVCNDRIRHREPENGPHRACALRHFEFDELGSVAPDAFHGILDDFGDD